MSYPYSTKLAVQNYLQQTIGSSYDAQLTKDLAAMSEFIDKRAGYPIWRDEETTRTYDGNGLRTLTIDPVHTISEVTLGTDVVEPAAAPYNNDIKTELRLATALFGADYGNIQVTGVHALTKDLPEQIAWACTVLTAIIVSQVKDQGDGVKSEKIGEYSVTFAEAGQRQDYQTAIKIIDSYRRMAF